MKNRLLNLTLILLILNLILLSLTIHNFFPKTSKITDKVQCENLSLKKTADCLNDYVNKIFKYKKNKDSNVLSLEELKTRGGDCKDWNTDFYKLYLDNLGFSTKEIKMFIREENLTLVYHTITLAYDNTGWCYFDQEYAGCFIYKNGIERTN